LNFVDLTSKFFPDITTYPSNIATTFAMITRSLYKVLSNWEKMQVEKRIIP